MTDKGLILSALGRAGEAFENGINESYICSSFSKPGGVSESRIIGAFYSAVGAVVGFFSRIYALAGQGSVFCRIARFGDGRFVARPARLLGDVSILATAVLICLGLFRGFDQMTIFLAAGLFVVFLATRLDIVGYYKNSLAGRFIGYILGLVFWSDIDGR